MKSKTISIRIPIEEYEELKRLTLDSGLGRSTVLREVLDRGIQDKKLDLAISKASNSPLSVSAHSEFLILLSTLVSACLKNMKKLLTILF